MISISFQVGIEPTDNVLLDERGQDRNWSTVGRVPIMKRMTVTWNRHYLAKRSTHAMPFALHRRAFLGMVGQMKARVWQFAILFGIFVFAPGLRAGSTTWKANPSSNDWNVAKNWTPETIPSSETDIATFQASNITNLICGHAPGGEGTSTIVGDIVFAPGATLGWRRTLLLLIQVLETYRDEFILSAPPRPGRTLSSRTRVAH